MSQRNSNMKTELRIPTAALIRIITMSSTHDAQSHFCEVSKTSVHNKTYDRGWAQFNPLRHFWHHCDRLGQQARGQVCVCVCVSGCYNTNHICSKTLNLVHFTGDKKSQKEVKFINLFNMLQAFFTWETEWHVYCLNTPPLTLSAGWMSLIQMYSLWGCSGQWETKARASMLIKHISKVRM